MVRGGIFFLAAVCPVATFPTAHRRHERAGSQRERDLLGAKGPLNARPEGVFGFFGLLFLSPPAVAFSASWFLGQKAVEEAGGRWVAALGPALHPSALRAG